MAVVRNAANTKLRGRVGQTTYYVSGQQQIARQALNNSNYGETARRSEAQQNRRVLWANLVNFYKISASWMPKAFETKRSNQSDYNKFMQVNVATARVALTKDEAAAGACIVDGYLISQGTLPSIEIVALTNQWRTNLALGALTIGDATTNAELTAALEANNANIRAGMQLSYVSYQQSVDPLGTPRAICRCYEITLSRTDTSLVRDHLPDFCSQTVDGNLGTSTDVSVGGFAYILSELQSGALRVSTQQLVVNNSVLINRYTSSLQVANAVSSYGVDREVILSPLGTVTQTAEEQPLYVQSITIDDKTYGPGAYIGAANTLAGKSLTVYMSSTKIEDVTSIAFISSSAGRYTASDINVSGKMITATMQSAISGVSPIVSMELTLSDNVVVTVPFSASPGGTGELN